MHLGLFGGSFNPPHVAHLLIAEAVREQFGLDRVLWMPSARPPHKVGLDLAEPHHRLAMTRLAVAGNDGFAVSNLELRRDGLSYTVDTLKALRAAHPEATFSLLIGGDSLAQFDTWRAPDEILTLAGLLAYPRPGEALPDLDRYAGRARLAQAPLFDVSATDIRARCRAGRSIRYLVPDAVRAYIAEHGLYGKQSAG